MPDTDIEAARETMDAALAYAARGWSVVPVVPREKRPLVRWTAYQARRAEPAAIRRWFARWPAANVAVVTGALSGLLVLDVDPRHGGEASLAALERRHGPLPATVEALTGGGGRHLYFAHPGGAVRNAVGIAPGLDLRGDDGLVVAPPSMHPSGRRYAWRAGRAPGETALAPPPPWLMPRDAPGPAIGHPVRYWRALLREAVPEGRRNDTVAALAGRLLWNGVDVGMVTELLLCWNAVRCHPPLAEDEVVRTVYSIHRLHARDRPRGDVV